MSIIPPQSQNNPDREEHSPDRANRSRAGRHRAEEVSWVGLAGRVLRSWPMTLRLALLVVLLTVTALIARARGIA